MLIGAGCIDVGPSEVIPVHVAANTPLKLDSFSASQWKVVIGVPALVKYAEEYFLTEITHATSKN